MITGADIRRLAATNEPPTVLLARRVAELQAELNALRELEGAVRRSVRLRNSTAAVHNIDAALRYFDKRRAFQLDKGEK